MELQTKIIDFNHLDYNLTKTITQNNFSFGPIVSIEGMSIDEEEQFFVDYEKYNIDTSEMKLVVEYNPSQNLIANEHEEVIEHYLLVLKEYNLTYNPPYNKNNNGYVIFNNIDQFLLINKN